MPRGVSRSDEAGIQGRIWAPYGVSNLCLMSEAIGDTVWTDPNTAGGISPAPATVVSTNNLAPSGTQTAARVTFASTGYLRRQKITGLTSGAVYTVSVWVKAAPTSAAPKFILATNNTAAWSTGASTAVVPTQIWQRIQATWTQSGTSLYIMLGADDAAGNLDGTCYGDTLLWGVTLSKGSFPAGYVRTTSAAVNGTLGPTDQTKEAAHLYWRWNLPTDPLPVGNPYKNRPPLIGN